ncbi:hypothetical protein IGB42_03440 [Andreprevotia sp. IGB-42]|uniref:DUF3617 domain-containing protein n=1 Tax=Andreprevotia sp. IGB-42 TaxID=2497473 RepID=UPI00135A7463|nr:DUF3617 family protein [Andreprevotia sp. IGB-42]KAF0812162.1 hypothetical protein IGB42_03440 [Andreprevotia sp. IGB-42]
MRIAICTLSVLPVLLIITPALARDLPPLMPSEGKWAITSQMMPEQKAAMANLDATSLAMMKQRGMEIDPKAGTMTMSMCLNKQNIDKWHDAGEASRAKGEQKCDDPKYSVTGNTLTMDMKCNKPEATIMHSVFQFNAAHDGYSFEHNITTARQQMQMKGSAKKIGPC